MKNSRQVLELSTKQRVEIVDITGEVGEILRSSGIRDGLLNVYSPHSTSGVVINENEAGLLEDFLTVLEEIIPQGAGYQHDRIDNNADSHIRGFILGCSETVPVENRRMILGTWQSIFFVELDGPRHRKLNITIIGE